MNLPPTQGPLVEWDATMRALEGDESFRIVADVPPLQGGLPSGHRITLRFYNEVRPKWKKVAWRAAFILAIGIFLQIPGTAFVLILIFLGAVLYGSIDRTKYDWHWLNDWSEIEIEPLNFNFTPRNDYRMYCKRADFSGTQVRRRGAFGGPKEVHELYINIGANAILFAEHQSEMKIRSLEHIINLIRARAEWEYSKFPPHFTGQVEHADKIAKEFMAKHPDASYEDFMEFMRREAPLSPQPIEDLPQHENDSDGTSRRRKISDL